MLDVRQESDKIIVTFNNLIESFDLPGWNDYMI